MAGKRRTGDSVELAHADVPWWRLQGTALFVMVSVIVASAAVLIARVGDRAERLRAAHTEMLHIAVHVERVNGIEWRAAATAEVENGLRMELVDAAGRINEAFGLLADSPNAELAVKVRPMADRYLDSIEREFAALESLQFEKAEHIAEFDVDPAFESLSDALNEELGDAQRESDAGFRFADRAMWGIMACTFGLLLGLFAMYHRSRARARAAALEQEALQRVAREREHDATHDELTGLANRRLFCERVDAAITHCRWAGQPLALLLLDLDRFKDVNDTLGHNVGDEVLCKIGERLASGLAEQCDLVARLGGDEFAVLLKPGTTKHEAMAAAASLRSLLERRIEVEGIHLHVEASVGVAVFPEHGDDRSTLLRRADVAMYASKTAGSGVELYELHRDHYTKDDLELTGALREAIANGELVLHFQPQYRVDDGRIASVEALVRWQHPTRGLLYPADFLRLAEQTSLMRPLTLTVLDQAIKQCAAWNAEGFDVAVAVNLGAASLFDGALADEVRDRLVHWGLPAARLELEITEKVFLADPMRSDAAIAKLLDLGVRLSIDDFGTGYSSIGRLKQLEITQLKIDRSFVSDMDVAVDNAAIVRAAIELGHALGLEVVAEGVETEAVWTCLQSLNCDLAQGFLRCRPKPAIDVTALLFAEAQRTADNTAQVAVLSVASGR